MVCHWREEFCLVIETLGLTGRQVQFCVSMQPSFSLGILNYSPLLISVSLRFSTLKWDDAAQHGGTCLQSQHLGGGQ